MSAFVNERRHVRVRALGGSCVHALFFNHTHTANLGGTVLSPLELALGIIKLLMRIIKLLTEGSKLGLDLLHVPS